MGTPTETSEDVVRRGEALVLALPQHEAVLVFSGEVLTFLVVNRRTDRLRFRLVLRRGRLGWRRRFRRRLGRRL
jgi:hypothetical protein